VKYPTGTELIKGDMLKGDMFDFQLKNEDLLITFVLFGIGESDTVIDYIQDGFCLSSDNGIKEEKIGSISIYRSERVFSASNICLDTVIALRRPNWFVDIQGKAKNQAGVTLYNEILSTFQLTRQ
jgi:hypothetical protein